MSPLHAETLSLHGPDAIAFAHAQLSSDIRSLDVGRWQWSSWLDPQGRVRALLHVLRTEDERLLLLLRGGHAENMARDLRPYIMRSQVDMEVHPPRQLLDAVPASDHHLHHDGDSIIIGIGSYAMRLAPATDMDRHDGLRQAWRRAGIQAGHPWLPETARGKVLAPSLSLRRLHGVSLDKGCFPGQEIVARLHYRGGCKQHLRHVRTAAALSPGSFLEKDGRNVATVLDSVMDQDACHALVVMRDTVPQAETSLEMNKNSIIIHTIKNLQIKPMSQEE